MKYRERRTPFALVSTVLLLELLFERGFIFVSIAEAGMVGGMLDILTCTEWYIWDVVDRTGSYEVENEVILGMSRQTSKFC